MLIISLACMTTIPGGTFTVDENDQVHCIEPMCHLSPTETAISDLTEEPAAGAVFEIPTAGPLCARVTALESLHLRAQPNERARVLAYLKNGELVRVVTFGQWWKIDTNHGPGYANARYMELSECEP